MKSTLRITPQELDEQTILPATIETASQMFREHGAIWLQNALPKELVQRLQIEYQEKYISQPPGQLLKKHALVGDQRLMVTVTIESAFNSIQLYANPILSSILGSLLGHQYAISSFGSVVAFPGAESQAIHFDHPPLFEAESDCVNLPPYAITVVVPLVDLTPETGSTAIWEGTHASLGARDSLRRRMEDQDWSGSVHPLPKMGDVYLMDYRVIHGGMANESDQPRPILYMVYGRPWFRDAFNFADQPPIQFGPGEFKKVPKRNRGLFAACQSKHL